MSKIANNNSRDNFLTNKELVKREKIATEYSVKCKCGHSILIANRYNKLVCSWCGAMVFKTPQDEFKYRLNERLKKNGKITNNVVSNY